MMQLIYVLLVFSFVWLIIENDELDDKPSKSSNVRAELGYSVKKGIRRALV
jgi:hypothetical protein